MFRTLCANLRRVPKKESLRPAKLAKQFRVSLLMSQLGRRHAQSGTRVTGKRGSGRCAVGVVVLRTCLHFCLRNCVIACVNRCHFSFYFAFFFSS